MIVPELGKYKLKVLSHPVLQKFMDDKFNEGYSRNSLAVLKGILSGALKEAVKDGYIIQSPMIYVDIQSDRIKPTVPTRKKKKELVTPEQWQAIKAKISRTP